MHVADFTFETLNTTDAMNSPMPYPDFLSGRMLISPKQTTQTLYEGAITIDSRQGSTEKEH